MAEREGTRSSIVKSTLYLIVTGVLVTVMGQWAINVIWPDSESLDDVVHKSPISLQRWQEMTVSLSSASEEMRQHIFDDYRGETVTWVGYFDQFNVNESETRSSQTAIILILYDSVASLNSSEPLGRPFVRCFFSDTQSHAISQLHRGQRIVVRGTLANPMLMGSILATDLNACELLAAEDDSHELAKVPGASLR